MHKSAPAAVLLCISMLAGQCPAGSYDLSGEYWYGWLGADATTGQPGSDSGEMVATPTSLTVTYTMDDGQAREEVLTITDTRFDPNGWLVMDYTREGQPETAMLAVNDRVATVPMKSPDESNMLGFPLFVRKASGLTDAEVVGEYAYFGHWLDVPVRGTSAEAGSVLVSADHTFEASLRQPDGSVEQGTGTWTLDAPNSTIALDIAGEGPAALRVGEGGLCMAFDIDPVEDDDLGFSFLMKKAAGRSESEAEGHYLLEVLYVDPDGRPSTQWGTLDIEPGGTYAGAFTESDGDSYSITGTWTMDGDGLLRAVDDDTGDVHEGFLGLDGDLVVISQMALGDEMGVIFLIEPVPEPAALSLLALGAAVGLLRRRTRH